MHLFREVMMVTKLSLECDVLFFVYCLVNHRSVKLKICEQEVLPLIVAGMRGFLWSGMQ